MKIKRFRIYDYKSIKDSGYCTLASDLTIFVGKNESGKTAVLEALRDFDRDVILIPDDALPLDNYDGDLRIEVAFLMDREELTAIQEKGNLSLPENIIEDICEKGITLVKRSTGEYTIVSEKLEQWLGGNGQTEDESNGVANMVSTTRRLTELMGGVDIPHFEWDINDPEFKAKTRRLVGIVKSALPTLPNKNVQEEVIQAIRKILEISNLLGNENPFEKTEFIKHIVERIPRFIYFSEFKGSLPFSIPISAAKDNQAIMDFAKITNLDIDKVINARDMQQRINLLGRHSASISGEFLNYWEQNKIELVAKTEGDQLLFGVKERNKTELFKVEQRSKGFQWFMSFYLRLNAQRAKNIVMLIDEPGMHLHAKAQSDILKFLEEKIAVESPVVFSTHSPYLLDSTRMDRVRLVIKDPERGTVIENRIYKNADMATLTPINTSMGVEITYDFSKAGSHNVILSHIADYYYFQALKDYMENPIVHKLNLIPSSRPDKLIHLISVMLGWNQEFKVLLDNNKEGKYLGKKVTEQFQLPEDCVNYISDEEHFGVEDLFTQDDFNRFVLRDEVNEDNLLLNSIYIRNAYLDKVFLARRFFDYVKANREVILLSKETLTAFRRVFDKVFKAIGQDSQTTTGGINNIPGTAPLNAQPWEANSQGLLHR